MMADQFESEKKEWIRRISSDPELLQLSLEWITHASRYRYSYHFTWLGRPIIQFPQDIIMMQEIIWKTRPDLIIESGIAHGGSLIFSASMQELLGNGGKVLGIDIDIREHNRHEIERHPMYRNIRMIEGSSTDEEVVDQVYAAARGKQVLLALDSLHTHEHVLKELMFYSPLVSRGNYIVVFDTIIENFPDGSFPDRPWKKGDNPMTAVKKFLALNDRFVVDTEITSKLLITSAPDGYLICVKDP
ncbi:MAG: cephalosporin hydroxylase family protein [Methanoregulaceae archaeon]|nr:cephalosporin hydroxylase family protein [Methanoregulaceae archaeon]